LTLVMTAVVPVVAIGAVVYGMYVKKLRKSFQDKLAAATATAEEAISNVRTVRSFSHEAQTQREFAVRIDESYFVGKKIALSVGIFMSVIGILAQGSIVLVLWYGGTLVLEDKLSPGSLISFLLYTMTVAFTFATISTLFGDFMQAVGAADRIFQLIDRRPAIPCSGGDIPKKVIGEIQLINVTFTYPSRPETAVLKDINLHLSPGKVVALVGPSGSGKSTIVNLIERFYDPDKGQILLDGTDIKKLDPEHYRKYIGFVSQEPVLFATTIKENIIFGAHSATEEQIISAAKKANAHDFISEFKEGYETIVGERGVRLSGGQKQRIAIARALVLDPKILLLDEATSALDAESEHLVQDAIDRAMENRAVLVIAHRLSTVINASQVLVLNKSEIVETGTHNDLIKAGGIYKKLVKRQLQQ